MLRRQAPRNDAITYYLTTTQTGILNLTIIQFLLLGSAYWDIRHRSADELNGSKPFWLVAVFVNFIGPLAYFLFGRKQTGEV